MARLECDSERVDGVTLVRCRLATDAMVRVTVEPTHDGPIWPPRRQGVPAPGWADGTWTGVVRPDGPRGLGYATPATVDDGTDPATVAAVEPAEAGDGPVSPRDVVRALGDPAPARDAVPDAPPGVATGDATAGDREQRPGAVADASDTTGGKARADPGGDAGPAAGGVASEPTGDGDHATPDATEPIAGAARLDAIEERLDTAADLAAVSAPEEARKAVADAGGVAAVRALVEQLEADRAYVRRVSERSTALAERADATTVPLAALERLA